MSVEAESGIKKTALAELGLLSVQTCKWLAFILEGLQLLVITTILGTLDDRNCIRVACFTGISAS